MQTPWNQNGLKLKTWVARELQALVQAGGRDVPWGRQLRASFIVHHLFLSTVTRYPELWSVRRDYYICAASEVIEIWKRLQRAGQGERIAFACSADEAAVLVDRLEKSMDGGDLMLHLVRLKAFLGLGEVEIAEILDLPERSIRRQVRALSDEWLMVR